jgi:hypothetical protein
VRALEGTPAFEKSQNDRKKVEMRFAHLKTHHRFELDRGQKPTVSSSKRSLTLHRQLFQQHRHSVIYGAILL